jgi:hypothetical protein
MITTGASWTGNVERVKPKIPLAILPMGVVKAPVGTLPLLSTPYPCVVPIIPLPGIRLANFASRRAAEWFHIRTEKLCYQSQFPIGLSELSIENVRFLLTILVKEKTSIFRYSALLAQPTTFEFHGGAPGHALHKARYPKLRRGQRRGAARTML